MDLKELIMKENDPIISIIMPVYNTGIYLKTAIESILNQTFKDFELILVNDGSTDGSGTLCDKYALQDKRIIVIHKINGGICEARNTAIQKSRGKYITFADHDDEIDPETLRISIARIEETGADMLKFGKVNIFIDQSGKIYRKDISKYKNKIYNRESIVSEYLKLKEENVWGNVWNVIFKRNIILQNNILFDPIFKIGGEDYDFCQEYSKFVNKLVTISNVFYIHYMRQGFSTSSKKIPHYEEMYFIGQKKLIEVLNNIHYKIKDKALYLNVIFYYYILPLISCGLKYNVEEKTILKNLINIKQQNILLQSSFPIIPLIKQNKKIGLFTYLYAKGFYQLLMFLVKLRYKFIK